MNEKQPLGSADDLVAAVVAAGPGAAAAVALAGVDSAQLTPAGLVDLAHAWQAQVAWAESQTAAALVRLAGPGGLIAPTAGNADAVCEQRSLLHEVGLAVGWTAAAVTDRYAVAAELADRLPATQAALAAGRISWQHARVACDELAVLAGAAPDDAVAAVRAVDALVADPQAAPVPPGRLRARVRRLVDRLHADTAARRVADAHRGRRAEKYPTGDGGSCLALSGDPRDVQAMWDALTGLAGPRESDDPRSLANRRFDAALAVILTAGHPARGDSAGTVAGRPLAHVAPPVQVQLVVDLATLAGLADDPVELVGHGPVPAQVARSWFEDATSWRRLVTDPVTGHLLDYGPERRLAPEPLKDFLKARDQRCTFPGCQLPARRCQADHEPPWRADGTGGRTSATDMAMLCQQHHTWKTRKLWRHIRTPDGGAVWVGPTGRTYRVQRPPAGQPAPPQPPGDPPEPQTNPGDDVPPF